MFMVKKFLYFIVVLFFLTISVSFHCLWAEEGSKEKASDLQKAESKQEQVPTQNQPQISFDSTRYNAGEVWEGDEVFHTFTVKNEGTAQLNINRVKPG